MTIEQNNDNTYQVTKDYTDISDPYDNMTFAEYIREKRKEFNDDNGNELQTRDLARIVGINQEMFRKIVNQNKPTKKRDCIIAICIALHMTPGEIDQALSLYPNMWLLNEKDPRDKAIQNQIYSSDYKITINELSDHLEKCGFKRLDIHNSRKHNSAPPSIKSKPLCEDLEIQIRTPIGFEHYYGDRYNSLCTRYDPSGMNITGDMILLDRENRSLLKLTSDTSGNRLLRILSDNYQENNSHSIEYLLGKPIKSVEEMGKYHCFFVKLEKKINDERISHLCILNDTKNYHIRSSARLIDNRIAVFAEKFNYSIPELNEYYVLVRTSGQYSLYVYSQSAFMAWYLSSDDYETYFETTIPSAIASFNSIKSDKDLVGEQNSSTNVRIQNRMRAKAFRELKPIVDDLYEKLKKREAFINNLDYIYSCPLDCLTYYKLESDFECEFDDYGNIKTTKLDSRDYPLPDGSTVNITLNDIYRSFELGFADIDDICRVKAKYGSIEDILN